MRNQLCLAAFAVNCLLSLAQGQEYCPAPVITYYAPAPVTSYSPVTQCQPCMPPVATVPACPAPATVTRQYTTNAPGHALSPPLTTSVTVRNTSTRYLTGLEIVYLDSSQVRRTTPRFDLAPGAQTRLDQLPDSPLPHLNTLLIGVFSKDGSTNTGLSGISKDQLFLHYCTDGVVAIGITLQ